MKFGVFTVLAALALTLSGCGGANGSGPGSSNGGGSGGHQVEIDLRDAVVGNAPVSIENVDNTVDAWSNSELAQLNAAINGSTPDVPPNGKVDFLATGKDSVGFASVEGQIVTDGSTVTITKADLDVINQQLKHDLGKPVYKITVQYEVP